MNTGWLESGFIDRAGGMGFGTSVTGVVCVDIGSSGSIGVLRVEVEDDE